MDVSAYLERMGAHVSGGPSAKSLCELHSAHLKKVPFENLDVFRRVPIVLEEDRILEKIVRKRRGGFCYELNFAFQWLLVQLGYEVTLLSGEVAHPEGGFGIPFDHMTLLVTIHGENYLADVGFGDSFLEPLQLSEGVLHSEPDYIYRLSRREDHWHLERAARDSGDFTSQYRFTLAPRRLSDFGSGCQYHQTSKESPFTQKVVTTRALDDGRVTLTSDRLILRRGPNKTETPIDGEAAWRDALARHFDIVLEVA